ncbi:hypothetical protein P378_14555 [Desulforamulus profundi]|uniref:Uncharacterized protein n=1 Tax=Desulforamulus profundi TaxID=1383067 RepID=A0A2C6MCE0_9FIRM|nr:hypothetical protein P378_14555 [Desulforamulus profundi]
MNLASIIQKIQQIPEAFGDMGICQQELEPIGLPH